MAISTRQAASSSGAAASPQDVPSPDGAASSRAVSARPPGECGPADGGGIWLSHHWRGDQDRCTRLGGRLVCRRCLVLYPVALLSAVLAGLGVRWPAAADGLLLWVLPVPAVVDFVADNLALVRYVPWRQMVVTALLGVALGVAYTRYLHDGGDTLVWAVVATYGGICLLAAFARAPRRR